MKKKDRQEFQALHAKMEELGRVDGYINLRHENALTVVRLWSESTCRHPCMRNIFLDVQSAIFYFQPPANVEHYNEMYNLIWSASDKYR